MAALTPAAGEGLVAALQRAQAELQSIQNRLEEEHAAASRKGDVNTLSLLTRLNRLRRCGRARAPPPLAPVLPDGTPLTVRARRELPAVQQECQQVLAAKQELVDAVKLGLGANTEQLHKVRRARTLHVPAQSGATSSAAFPGRSRVAGSKQAAETACQCPTPCWRLAAHPPRHSVSPPLLCAASCAATLASPLTQQATTPTPPSRPQCASMRLACRPATQVGGWVGGLGCQAACPPASRRLPCVALRARLPALRTQRPRHIHASCLT